MRLGEVVVVRITVEKIGVHDIGGSGPACCEAR